MKRLNLSELPAAARRPVWDAISAHSPAVAALLQEPELRSLRAAFDCSVSLDLADLAPEVIATIRQHAEHLV
ncbi:MAG: hypothetical protein ACNA75_06250 [Thiohalomonadaceae bacterium]